MGKAALCVVALLLAGAAQAAPYTIGAWYFTLWHRDAASGQIAASARLYGRPDPWGGVRDFATGHGAFAITDAASGHPVDYSRRVPLSGFYDLSDPGVIDTQLAEGARAGLSFFAFYFYIDGATGLPMPISSPVARFYTAPNRHGMALLLAPIVNPDGGPKLTLQHFRDTLLPILTGYLASPAALRIDDRPALVDWWLAPDGDYAARYRLLRAAVRARTGRDPFIIKMNAASVAPAAIHGEAPALHPDAYTCFAFPMRPAQPYPDWIASLAAGMQRQIGAVADAAPYLPCSGIGQDARPWFGVGWSGGRMDARGYTRGVTPDSFRAALLRLRTTIDSGIDPMRVAILYAWNEWGEAAASIEPSRADGYAYSDMIRNVFGHGTDRTNPP